MRTDSSHQEQNHPMIIKNSSTPLVYLQAIGRTWQSASFSERSNDTKPKRAWLILDFILWGNGDCAFIFRFRIPTYITNHIILLAANMVIYAFTSKNRCAPAEYQWFCWGRGGGVRFSSTVDVLFWNAAMVQNQRNVDFSFLYSSCSPEQCVFFLHLRTREKTFISSRSEEIALWCYTILL